MPAGSPEQEMINTYLRATRATIWTNTFCPYTQVVKEILDGEHIAWKEINLEMRADQEDLVRALGMCTGQYTFPSIYLGFQHIGGLSQLRKLEHSGELK